MRTRDGHSDAHTRQTLVCTHETDTQMHTRDSDSCTHADTTHLETLGALHLCLPHCAYMEGGGM